MGSPPFRLNRVLPLRLFRPVVRLPRLPPVLRLSRLRLSRPVGSPPFRLVRLRSRPPLRPLLLLRFSRLRLSRPVGSPPFRLVWLARRVSSRLPFRLNRAPPFRSSRPAARLPLLPALRFSPRLPLVRLRSRLPFRFSRPVALPWLLLAFRFSRLRPFRPAMPCLRPFGCRIRRSRLPSRRSLLRQELSLPPFSSLSLVGLERHRARLRSRPPLRSDRLPTSPLPSKPPRPPCRRTVRSDHPRLLKRSRRRMPRRPRSRSPEPRGMADRLSL